MARFAASKKILIGGIAMLALAAALVVVATLLGSTTTPAVATVSVNQPVYEFFAAHTGVQCEILTNFTDNGPVAMNSITCFTNQPARRVALDDVGNVVQCAGTQCLANPGLNTPYLKVGTRVVSGKHHCDVTAAGVRCGNSSSATFTMTPTVVTTHGLDPIQLAVSDKVFEFYAPASSGVECEITTISTLCITNAPAQRAVLSAGGTLRTCKGVGCLSNPGLGTPTLLVNTVVHSGNFTCTAQAKSVTCQAKGHEGFTISKTGITTAIFH